jgi:hypothetical protein
MDVTLPQVIPFGQESWLLRYLAHGKFLQFEGFRSKKEAIISTHLMKLARESKGQLDWDIIAQQVAQKNGASFESWEDKVTAYQQLAQTLFDHAKTLMPKDVPQQTAARIRELEQQLAEARAATPSRHQDSDEHTDLTSPSKPNNIPKSSPIKDALQGNKGVPANKRQSDDQQWRRDTRPRTLSSNSPGGHSKASVTTWIKNLKLTQVQTTAFNKHVNDLQQYIKDPMHTPLADIAAEWGLPVSLASKMADTELTRCIAVCCSLQG